MDQTRIGPKGKHMAGVGRRVGVVAVVMLALTIPSSPEVVGQNTPEQSYFEWARPSFPSAEFAERRARLAAELREGPSSVLLVPSSEGRSGGASFRQDDNFHYFTGLEVPRSVLAIPSSGGQPILFAPRRDFRFESASRRNDFPGRPLADDPALAEWSGLRVLSSDSLMHYVRTWRDAGTQLLVTASPAALLPVDPSPFVTPVTPPVHFARYLQATVPGLSVGSALEAIRATRGVKTPAAIDKMRAVTQLTADAIATAAMQVQAGVTERALEAAFEVECKRGGGQRIPFHPIVKSGPNSLWPWRILAAHYDRRNRALADGELVIFDVGCELDHYVSDVGRTFPVSGSFTPRQREILEMEVGVADRVIEAIRPGVTFAELRAVADAAIPEEHRPYMQAALFFGHHIGLSTGDPIDETAPLEAGMVFTVEPWYYNHVEQISVFTEDVVVVTSNGVEVLSASLPRTPAELEAMVGGR